MFEAHKALFLYCTSPVHMGAGTAIGLIDNPIQRERHTEYPMMAGSGLKGAVRHAFTGRWDKRLVERLFGPDSGARELNAGAVSFGDGQLVAFPVRCTRRGYVYAVCPNTLARLRRLLDQTDIQCDWKIPEVAEGACLVADEAVLSSGKLYLEAFELAGGLDESLQQISAWLATHALPEGDGYEFFSRKLRTDLVLIPDDDFGYFVKNATVVESHVRIDDETGAAAATGLFYTENLPPESLLIAPLMASKERTSEKHLNGSEPMQAEEVLRTILDGPDGDASGLDGRLLQVGGDSTTGRGQVIVHSIRGGP